MDRKFDWYNNHRREDVLDTIREDAHQNKNLLLQDTKEIVQEYNFSPFDNIDEIVSEIELLKKEKI